eukprot:m.136572 g.136572  ORF g.136572 m.136572 type:complete len:913 (-) comp16976_c2_seq5:202-2940(-)
MVSARTRYARLFSGVIVAALAVVSQAHTHAAVADAPGSSPSHNGINEYPGDPVSAVTALLQRVLPAELHSSFVLERLPASNPGAMELASAGGNVVLRGTGGVELASALNWYLNDYLNVTVDWNTYGEGQFPTAEWPSATAAAAVATALPLPSTTRRRVRQADNTYYMNVCTYGYSLAFVPWAYWEKHIDWMALNGINLPLAFVGQEWLWVQVFDAYNISRADQYEFYSGPAFLPWFRMGNMQGWGGGGARDLEWFEARKALQLQVLSRMRGLGMRPVLPAFAGHLPSAFAKQYPHANTSTSPEWANFLPPYGSVTILEPSDPMFVEIGNKFVALQTAVYGTDHIYNCDTYNEMNPPTNDPAYLAQAAKAVYQGMAGADAEAVWLMQGWLFSFSRAFWQPAQIQAYLGAVPDSRMWILDLFGTSHPVWSTTDSFYGKPFILCTLLNFGGQQGLTGDLEQVHTAVQQALDANATINGVGITMEGIWTNYPMFELALLQSWADEPRVDFNVSAWIKRYGSRRYGKSVAEAVQAWETLGATVYAGQGGGFGSAISGYPSLPSMPPPPIPGYTRYSKDGYWANFQPGNPQVDSIFGCAQQCDKLSNCKGFEVYVDATNFTGNCYVFLDTLKPPFFNLQPCLTFVRTSEVEHKGKEHLLDDTATEAQRSFRSATLTLAQHAQPQAQAQSQGQPQPQPGITPRQSLYRPGPDLTVTDTFKSVWQLLMAAVPELGHVPSFRFDLIDVAREVIAANFSASLGELEGIMRVAPLNTSAARAVGDRMLTTMDDYDALLSTDTNFMLGRWIDWARSSIPNASTATQDWLEFNARNQITLWGPHGEINDYAKKEWGGLVRNYYKPRWSLAIDMVVAGNWDPSTFHNAVMQQVELPWSNATTPVFPVKPEADLLTVITSLYAEYGA